ncbi:MAG: hypothetical protein ACRD3J_12990 [Thermoanaerobaculia bacterium]
MKLTGAIAAAAMLITSAAFAAQDAVHFDVVLMRDGKFISSPKVVAEFGKKVSLAQGQVMKFEYSVPGTNARFLVKPRLVKRPVL